MGEAVATYLTRMTARLPHHFSRFYFLRVDLQDKMGWQFVYP